MNAHIRQYPTIASCHQRCRQNTIRDFWCRTSQNSSHHYNRAMQHVAISVAEDCMALSINLVQRYGFSDTKQRPWRENLIIFGNIIPIAAVVIRQPYRPARGTTPIRRVVGLSHWGSRISSSYCGKQNTAAVVRQPYNPARGHHPSGGLVGLSHWGSRIM